MADETYADLGEILSLSTNRKADYEMPFSQMAKFNLQNTLQEKKYELERKKQETKLKQATIQRMAATQTKLHPLFVDKAKELYTDFLTQDDASGMGVFDFKTDVGEVSRLSDNWTAQQKIAANKNALMPEKIRTAILGNDTKLLGELTKDPIYKNFFLYNTENNDIQLIPETEVDVASNLRKTFEAIPQKIGTGKTWTDKGGNIHEDFTISDSSLNIVLDASIKNKAAYNNILLSNESDVRDMMNKGMTESDAVRSIMGNMVKPYLHTTEKVYTPSKSKGGGFYNFGNNAYGLGKYKYDSPDTDGFIRVSTEGVSGVQGQFTTIGGRVIDLENPEIKYKGGNVWVVKGSKVGKSDIIKEIDVSTKAMSQAFDWEGENKDKILMVLGYKKSATDSKPKVNLKAGEQ